MNKKTPSQKRKNKKAKLYLEQRGLCHYCRGRMTIESPSNGILSDRAATFEHLDHKFSPFRGLYCNQKRIVLACKKCNHKKGREDELRLYRKK